MHSGVPGSFGPGLGSEASAGPPGARVCACAREQVADTGAQPGSAQAAGSAPAERDALAAGESRAPSPASAQLAALRTGCQGAACPIGLELGPARRSNTSSDSGARACGSGVALSPGTLRLGSLEGLHFGSMGALGAGAAGGARGSDARGDLDSRGRSLPNMPAPSASFGGCAAGLSGAREPPGAAAASAAAPPPGPEAAPAPRPHAHRRGMDSMEDVHMSLADSGLGSLDRVCAAPGDGAEEMMQGMLGAPDAAHPSPEPNPAPAGLPPPGALRGVPIGADSRGGTLPLVLEGGAWDLPWGLPSPLERKAASFGPGTQRGALGAAPGAGPVLGFQEPGVASPGFPAGFKDPLLEPPDPSELELMAGGSTTAFAVPPAPAAAEGSGTPETLKLLLNLDNPPRAPPAPRAQEDPLDNLLQFARAQPPPPPAAAQPPAMSAPKAQDAVRPA